MAPMPKPDFLSGLWIEYHSPVLAGIVAAVVYWLLPDAVQHPPRFPEILAQVMQVAAIFAGFLGTSMTFVLALRDSAAIKRLQGSPYYIRFVRYLWQSIVAQLLLAGLAFVTLYFLPAPPASGSNPPPTVAVFFFWVVVSGAMMSGVRVIRILIQVFEDDTTTTQ
jgi:hypothetical protein